MLEPWASEGFSDLIPEGAYTTYTLRSLVKRPRRLSDGAAVLCPWTYHTNEPPKQVFLANFCLAL